MDLEYHEIKNQCPDFQFFEIYDLSNLNLFYKHVRRTDRLEVFSVFFVFLVFFVVTVSVSHYFEFSSFEHFLFVVLEHFPFLWLMIFYPKQVELTGLISVVYGQSDPPIRGRGSNNCYSRN